MSGALASKGDDMANVSEWSANELENLFLDDMNLSDERGRRAAKIMAAVKAKEDEQDAKLDAVAGGLVFRGIKATYAELEAVESPAVGDMYSVTGLGGENYAWDGEAWDSLGTSDANVVHKSGNEEIEGTKSFTSEIQGSTTGNFNLYCKPVRGDEDADLDDFDLPGSYIIYSPDGQQTRANFPFGTNGFLFVLRSSITGNARQFFIRTGTVDVNDHNFATRQKASGAWSTWRNILTTGGSTGSVKTGADVVPGATNTYSLGSASSLWKQVFSSTASINTSDERIKQNIEAIPDNVLDVWEKLDFKQFKFKTAVDKKNENARLHCGLVAQRISEAFADSGLDATSYGFFCHDEWDAVETEDGSIPAGDLYSLRYEECLCLEAACQRRRAERLESRIAALEAIINGKQQ